MAEALWKRFLKNASSLITPYEQTRAGFVALALEKNRLGTPYVEEAKVLKLWPQKLLSYLLVKERKIIFNSELAN
ncbi:MAG: hypothetical protein A2167_07525 [Planctomycetes bacterium RBG_13_46_10]|nr:MAG: hypothetical protein A2167_07525 [Planctomycetes bacterium RBG_13_46_10]